MQKRFFLLSAASAALVLVGAGCSWSGSGNADVNVNADRGPVACTMEAKQCPDGSYVGRQGPNCEFSPCPGPKQPEVNINVRSN